MVYSNDCIASTKVLTRKSRSAEAETLLHKCATAVKHLMRRNGWHIRELSEFYPKAAGLLGMNKNRSVILVRLRYASDDTLLYPFEELLGTLLHELAHMVHSDHSVAFYELWDKNRAEVEADLASGALNYDFSAPGRVVGGGAAGGVTGDPRQKAAEAAIKRRGRFTGAGAGKRLGGGEGEKRLSKQTLKERIARSAERRLNDNKWCNAEEDSDEVYREYSQEEVTLCNPCGTGNINNSSSSTRSSDSSTNSSSNRSNPKRQSAATEATENPKARSSSLKGGDAAAARGAAIEMVCRRCGYCTSGDEDCPSCQDRIYMQFKQRPSKQQRLLVDLTSPPKKGMASRTQAAQGSSSSTSNNNDNNNMNDNYDEAWECRACTFLNPLRVAKCSMCETDYGID